jgi:separase
LGKQCDEILEALSRAPDGTLHTFRERLMQHHSLVHKAAEMLQANVTLSLLTESTLALPGLTVLDCERPEPKKKAPPMPSSKMSSKAPGKSAKIASELEERPESLLFAARACLSDDQGAKSNMRSTSETHLAQSSLSSVSLLASAVADCQTDKLIAPADEAMRLDLPRIKALQLEKGSVLVDLEPNDDSRQVARPDVCPSSGLTNISGSTFQNEFIDIIPTPWTAVSLCLSEDCNDLYIARYRSGVAPFTLKLPFSRHKPDKDDCIDELAFNYHKGKADLQEIIGLSNYTCHNPGSIDAKGAKTKWWKQREDLDRKLHELLINIENIWFGGFKAIFSQHRSRNDALLRFRASFDQILARHLPSRWTGKRNTEKLEIENQVLELFIGLETVRAMNSDLEEPLTDLLYFVVDLLQFKGERNAYDEIDFDSMTIDVLDALRTYHDLSDIDSNTSQHLILVLDRRLQAFPWESLPCLEGSSVSRVGSMLSLRDCIVSMRKQSQASIGADLANGDGGCHMVCRNSGTYILNPSSDLAPTQTLLGPSLSTLLQRQGSRWSSIVNKIPSEDEFSSALISSSVMLYFGHGAGSQYIRPRTIKRLERCSEVVWLMGCSSGAVWEYGDLEPCAVPLAYLLAGKKDSESDPHDTRQSESTGKCMSVIATLWDVTDKDIDRFTLAVGEDWGLWLATGDSKIPTKTPRKREIVTQPSTPVQVPKTPKTPAPRKTPAIAKTPAISRGRPQDDRGRKLSLVEAVARSRDACVLRYLNGAAPVVYGVPVYLGD